jgi:four helix bundle protein
MSMKLAKACYVYASTLPSDEKYGLVNQIRRAATSPACNIAEGYGRNTDPAFAQYLRVAKGSLNELVTLLILAHEVGYPPAPPETFKLLGATGTKVRNSIDSLASSHHSREARAAYDTEAARAGGCQDVVAVPVAYLDDS